MSEYIPASDPIATALEIAPTIKAWSREVDDQAKFPVESLALLRRSGLMGILVPHRFGGGEASIDTIVRVAQIIAGACLSTGMIWGMHMQQVACLIDYADEVFKTRLLPRIAAGQVFIASITSEKGKGGHLLTAFAPLEYQDGQVVISREAPVCTGGAYGDGYLVTMRRSEDSPPEEVALVYAERDQLEVTSQGTWNALGMRGTQSVSMKICGMVPPDQILHAQGGFTQIALTTMVPFGHIAWASCWLGAVKSALRAMQQLLRDPQRRKGYPLQSDLFMEKWARIRLEIETIDAYLEKVTRTYGALRATGTIFTDYKSPAYNIQINNLKILASEQLFKTTNHLIELAGLQYGYLKNDAIPLERVMRDLRSASLMYSNDRLLLANGRLALLALLKEDLLF